VGVAEGLQPGLLPGICSWSYWLWETGRKLKFVPPINNRDFFERMRFIEAISAPDASSLSNPTTASNNLPISTFLCSDNNASLTHPRRIVDFTKTVLPINNDTEQALLTVLSELVENIVRHSNSSKYGTYCVACHPNTKKLAITLSDPGIGIYTSFMNGYSEDAKCRIGMGESPISIAVEPLQSSKFGRGHSGYGLFFTRELVRLNRGTLSITSHDETVSYFESEQKYVHAQTRGVTIVILLDLNNRLDASRAWSALPPGDPDDYVTVAHRHSLYTTYELTTQDGRIVSRTAAQLLRTEIAAIIKSGGGINIDLSRVSVITPSAADELFGQLYHDLGHASFVRSVRVCGASIYQRQLIELIISHRRSVWE
jgi:hypothetical protein